MSAALLLPHLLPFAPLTASLCIHLPFSQSADNHNGMQVRYLVGARAAVGRWVSMRHYVMASQCLDLCKRCGSSVSQYIQHRIDFARSFSSDD